MAYPAVAGRTGRCRTPGRRPLRRRTPVRRMVGRRAAGRTREHRTARRMPGLRPAAPCPTASACPMRGRPAADRVPPASTGCLTGAECRRTRTASTGRLDPACREGRRVGTMGRARLPRTHTPETGAARARCRARRRPATAQAVPSPAALAVTALVPRFPAVRFLAVRFLAALAGTVQAVRFLVPRLPEDRLRGRRTEFRRPTEVRGDPVLPGPRRCASIRRPDRATKVLTAGSGSARCRSRRVR